MDYGASTNLGALRGGFINDVRDGLPALARPQCQRFGVGGIRGAEQWYTWGEQPNVLCRDGEMTTINETLAREILDRLTRLEAESAATATRIDDTNKRIDETNARITETNMRITESNAETNARIAESNTRIAENNARIDDLTHASTRNFDRLTSRMDKLFYTIIALSTAVIVSLVTGQILD